MFQFLIVSPTLRRAICLTVLVVLFIGMIGLPVQRVAPAAKSEQFPCQNCPCGCSTADFCWDKCCCHTDAEKLRWAADHGVAPPEFLVARVSSSPTDSSARCCQTRPTCCQADTDCCATEDSVVAKTVTSTGTCDERRSDFRSTRQIGIVRLVDAAKCLGKDLVWSVFNSLVIPRDHVGPTHQDPLVLYRTCLVDDEAFSVDGCPDPPVPWLVFLSSVGCLIRRLNVVAINRS